MKTLLLVLSISVALIVGCGKKDDGKETGDRKNDALVQDVDKVNADLEKIRTRDINTSDPQSLKKVSVSLKESRDKINAIESRINAARRAELAAGKGRPTPLPIGVAVNPSNPMSEGLFKKKMQELAKSMETGDSTEQLTAVKSVRELQGSYPDRDYSVVVIPLMRIVKNENASGPLRIVAARALYRVDSERGNFAIKGVGSETNDKSVRRVCTLLSAERARQDELLEQELDREEALAKR